GPRVAAVSPPRRSASTPSRSVPPSRSTDRPRAVRTRSAASARLRRRWVPTSESARRQDVPRASKRHSLRRSVRRTAAACGGSAATATPGESAAGKPCVARTDELPPGAPEVPVETGPPPTDLVVEDLVEGQGEAVPAGATVTVHYIGVSCSTGTIFDSSYERGE